MTDKRLILLGKSAAAITVIAGLFVGIYKVMIYLQINPVLAGDARKTELRSLQYDLPTLRAEQRRLKITRGQLKLLPPSISTIGDIEAYNDQINDYDDLITSAKHRKRALAK